MKILPRSLCIATLLLGLVSPVLADEVSGVVRDAGTTLPECALSSTDTTSVTISN